MMKKVFYIVVMFFYVVTSEVMAAPFEFETISTLRTVAMRAKEVRDRERLEPRKVLVVISVDNVTSKDKGVSFVEGKTTADVYRELLRNGFKVVINTSRCELMYNPAVLDYRELAHRFQATAPNDIKTLSIPKQFDLTGQFPNLEQSYDMKVGGFQCHWEDGVLFGGPKKVEALVGLLPKMGDIRHIIAVDHQDFFLKEYHSHPQIQGKVSPLRYQ